MDMINSLGVASVAGITVIVFLLGMIVHASKLNNKWIPSICGVAGAVLGIVGLRVMPDFPATDIISAVAVGIVSGLAATGVDQMVKKMTEKDEGKAEGFVGYVDEEEE
jgi:O-antigen/teichoic acid export membrane protein